MASEKYKGYRISGWTLVKHSAREDLCSRGTVSILTKVGSIIEVQQLEGPAFHNKKEAEEHGLQLCKEWIDKLKRPESVVAALSSPKSASLISQFPLYHRMVRALVNAAPYLGMTK